MTLNTLFTSRHAIYLTGDFRITYPGRGFEDALETQKMVPAIKFGWLGLISFSGRAELGDRTPVGTWIASQVEPERMRLTRTDLLARLRDGADRWLSKVYGYKELSVVFAGFDGRSPFAYLLSNFQDQYGVRFKKNTPQLLRYDIDAKANQVLCFGETTSITTARRLALARQLITSDTNAARQLLADFNEERWKVSLGAGTVSRECVVGSAFPTGGGTVQPFGLHPEKQYLPQFIVNEFAAMGEIIRPKRDSEGRELPIIWNGMTIGTNGQPKKGRMVVAHAFQQNQLEIARSEEPKQLPYNTASVSWVAPVTGKVKVTTHHGLGNRLESLAIEYVSTELSSASRPNTTASSNGESAA